MGLREDKRLAVWHDIRDAAWRLFEERGYDDVSVEEIAAAAGVSRSSFFNYFHAKEAVVVDPSPEEAAHLEELMAAQGPQAEPWPAVTAVLVGLVEDAAAITRARRRLTATDPALERRGQELGEELAAAMRTWMRGRLPDDPLGADLVVDLALAASRTAWVHWPVDAPVDEFLALLREVLRRTGGPTGTGGLGAQP